MYEIFVPVYVRAKNFKVKMNEEKMYVIWQNVGKDNIFQNINLQILKFIFFFPSFYV